MLLNEKKIMIDKVRRTLRCSNITFFLVIFRYRTVKNIFSKEFCIVSPIYVHTPYETRWFFNSTCDVYFRLPLLTTQITLLPWPTTTRSASGRGRPAVELSRLSFIIDAKCQFPITTEEFSLIHIQRLINHHNYSWFGVQDISNDNTNSVSRG